MVPVRARLPKYGEALSSMRVSVAKEGYQTVQHYIAVQYSTVEYNTVQYHHPRHRGHRGQGHRGGAEPYPDRHQDRDTIHFLKITNYYCDIDKEYKDIYILLPIGFSLFGKNENFFSVKHHLQ